MAFKLLIEAEKRWRKIKGFEKIQDLLDGKLYKDEEVIQTKKTQQGEVA